MQTLRDVIAQQPWVQNRWLQAAAILLIAWAASRLFDWLITRVVARWSRRTRTDIDDQLIAALHAPVRISVVLVGLRLATEVLAIPANAETFTVRMIKSVAILIWLGVGFRLCTLVLGALSRIAERLQIINERTVPLFDNLTKVLLLGGGAYLLLLTWDLDVAPWLASAGIVGIAVGFAAKDTLANLFAGIFISADAPYKIGDFIVLDSGERGRVTQIGIRTTRLLTRDDIEITIPNAVIANAKIVNESGGPWEKERVRIRVGVAYGSDLDHVYEVLLAVAASHEHVCEDPEPRVRFRSFGDSSLDLELLCWIDEPVLRGRMVHDLNTSIYKAFHREGIQIPFPQRDVHLYPTPQAPPV